MAGADVFPSQSDGIVARFQRGKCFFIENIVITKNLTDFCFFFNIKTIVQCKEKCRLGKISESQMGFEPTTLRDLVGCSNH